MEHRVQDDPNELLNCIRRSVNLAGSHFIIEKPVVEMKSKMMILHKNGPGAPSLSSGTIGDGRKIVDRSGTITHILVPGLELVV